MRELKFRVWLHDSKQWGDVACLEVFNTTGKLEYLYQHQQYTIQQYTGMKDRNGAEVYEGDIVAEKLTEEMAANGDSATVGVVYFAAGTFLIDGDGALYEHVFSDSPHILEDFIVIGNKFTNPELLTK